MNPSATPTTAPSPVPRDLLARPGQFNDRVDLIEISIGLISTYPPTRCGIGRFSESLRLALETVAPKAVVGIARLVPPGEDVSPHRASVDVVFDPSSSSATRAVARRMSRHDVALLQHEYGLYGPDDGHAVVDLVDQIAIPLVSVLHTVLSDPSPRQRSIVEALARSGSLVVPTKTARRRLITAYDVDASTIHVIPHGAALSPAAINPDPRRRIITWGLLGPGKGIERSLRALALLDLDPPVTYDIVGQTHPNVLAGSGQEYRRSIEELVAVLGLESRVRFIDRYVDESGLQRLVSNSDLVVTPYDTHEQICSGVLTEAVAAGRPVVATAYPHAEELLAGGAGVVVSHTDEEMAEAIGGLLTDDAAYIEAARHARLLSGSLSWEGVGRRYLELLHSLRTSAEVA